MGEEAESDAFVGEVMGDVCICILGIADVGRVSRRDSVGLQQAISQLLSQVRCESLATCASVLRAVALRSLSFKAGGRVGMHIDAPSTSLRLLFLSASCLLGAGGDSACDL